MDLLLFEVFFNLIGRACLYIRYREREKIKKILNDKYQGRFSAAGLIFSLNFVAGLGILVLGSVVVVMLIVIIKRFIFD